jgi:hypothetical protein
MTIMRPQSKEYRNALRQTPASRWFRDLPTTLNKLATIIQKSLKVYLADDGRFNKTALPKLRELYKVIKASLEGNRTEDDIAPSRDAVLNMIKIINDWSDKTGITVGLKEVQRGKSNKDIFHELTMDFKQLPANASHT